MTVDIDEDMNSANRLLEEKVSITLIEEGVKTINLLVEEDQRSFSQYINRVFKPFKGTRQCDGE